MAPNAVPASVSRPLVPKPSASRCSLAAPSLAGRARVTSTGPAGPLYVVDGVRVEPPASLDGLHAVSVDTISGAAAAALYGRAESEGVITTRAGMRR